MKSILQIENISVRYPRAVESAIESITFELQPKTITALIGPNGSGKSTLIKAILGLIPYQGKISMYGKPIEKSYRDIGYVPQRFSFDTTFPITVEEFISLTNTHKDISPARIQEVLEQVHMLSKKNAALSQLSGGQLQRVLLARALVRKPKLLILDEPEAGVDVGGEQTFYNLLEKMVEEHAMTVLIATHELDIVYRFAENVICINRVLVCSGPPKKTLNQQMFTTLYGHELQFYGHHHDNDERIT